jgi:hypothetical protein
VPIGPGVVRVPRGCRKNRSPIGRCISRRLKDLRVAKRMKEMACQSQTGNQEGKGDQRTPGRRP